MRLMIGTNGEPRLLVEVQDNYDPNNFKFLVINGQWEGQFNNGDIAVYGDEEHAFPGNEILTDNQDRLRGDYNEVFHHFDNKDYISPTPATKPHPIDYDLDDDIPF